MEQNNKNSDKDQNLSNSIRDNFLDKYTEDKIKESENSAFTVVTQKINLDKEKTKPYPNNGFMEKEPGTMPIIRNKDGKIVIEYVEECVYQTEMKEKDIQRLIDNEKDIDNANVKIWIEKNKNLPYDQFSTAYYHTFPSLSSWLEYKKESIKRNNETISYRDYRTAVKKDEVLWEERYNGIKELDKKIGDMWESGEIVKFASSNALTSNEEVNMNQYNGKKPTHDNIICNEPLKNRIKDGYTTPSLGLKKNPYDKETDDYNEIYSELESMEATLSSSDGFEEHQIIKLKERIKEFESKLKEKVKPKTITISNNVHNRIKNHCSFFNLKIGDWVEKTLLEKIDDSTPKLTNISTEAETAEIKDKYKTQGIRNKMVKSSKLIAIGRVSKNFNFVGYHFVDGQPVYDYIGNSYEEDIKKLSAKIEVLPEGNIPLRKKYNAPFTDHEVDFHAAYDVDFVPEPEVTFNTISEFMDIAKSPDKLKELIERLKKG